MTRSFPSRRRQEAAAANMRGTNDAFQPRRLGMEALTHNRVALIATLLTAATLSGCRSGGSRLASLNPWRSSAVAEEATAVARSAPELPSAKLAQETTTTPGLTPNAATLAAAPTAQYPATQYPTTTAPAGGSATKSPYPTTDGSATKGGSATKTASASPYPTTAASPYPSTSAPAASAPTASPYPTTSPAVASATTQSPAAGSGTRTPYDPAGYAATTPEPSSKPASSGSATRSDGSATRSGGERYAAATMPDISLPTNSAPATASAPGSRYGESTMPSIAGLASSASEAAKQAARESLANTPLPTADTGSSLGSIPAYPSSAASPQTPPLSSNPLAGVTPPLAPGSTLPGIAQASATLPTAPPAGAYRPGGTSTYTASSAVSIATRPSDEPTTPLNSPAPGSSTYTPPPSYR